MLLTAENFKEFFTQNRRAHNGWCTIPSAVTAEIMARAGFDMLTIDLQHGLIDFQTAVMMLQATSAHPLPKFIRVPWNEPNITMKCLDAGATGIICPLVNTAEDARKLVANTHYPPLGGRSYGPIRALTQFEDYVVRANDLVQVFATIETVEGFENREEIIAVEGLSGIYVGPYNLTLSMGYGPAEGYGTLPDPGIPAVHSAVSEILASVKQAGLLAGVHCGHGAMVRRMLNLGFDFVSCSSDTTIFARAVEDVLIEIRE